MAKTVRRTISLPADLAREVEAFAAAEGKTFSAAVRDALRRAHIVRRTDELRLVQGYWSRKAREMGLVTEADLKRYLAA